MRRFRPGGCLRLSGFHAVRNAPRPPSSNASIPGARRPTQATWPTAP